MFAGWKLPSLSAIDKMVKKLESARDEETQAQATLEAATARAEAAAEAREAVLRQLSDVERKAAESKIYTLVKERLSPLRLSRDGLLHQIDEILASLGPLIDQLEVLERGLFDELKCLGAEARRLELEPNAYLPKVQKAYPHWGRTSKAMKVSGGRLTVIMDRLALLVAGKRFQP